MNVRVWIMRLWLGFCIITLGVMNFIPRSFRFVTHLKLHPNASFGWPLLFYVHFLDGYSDQPEGVTYIILFLDLCVWLLVLYIAYFFAKIVLRLTNRKIVDRP